MDAVRADKDGKFEASARRELGLLRSWPIGKQPSVINPRKTEKRLLEWRKKTQVEVAIR